MSGRIEPHATAFDADAMTEGKEVEFVIEHRPRTYGDVLPILQAMWDAHGESPWRFVVWTDADIAKLDENAMLTRV